MAGRIRIENGPPFRAIVSTSEDNPDIKRSEGVFVQLGIDASLSRRLSPQARKVLVLAIENIVYTVRLLATSPHASEVNPDFADKVISDLNSQTADIFCGAALVLGDPITRTKLLSQ